jgi:type IV secretion system protein TrbL
MNSTGIIDGFLNTYNTYINSGFGLLGGEVAFLATTLVVIDVIIAALFWAWGGGEEVIANLIKKTLYVGFFALIIGNWQNFATIIFNSFSGLGLKAAGSTFTVQQLMQPSSVAQSGFNAAAPISQAIQTFPISILSPSSWGTVLGLTIAWVITILSFFILAVQLFITLVEWKLTTLAGFILVPFGLFGRTAFLAERVLGNVFTSGVKIMVLAIVVGIGSSLFKQFPQTISAAGAAASASPLALEQAWIVALAAMTLLGLGIHVSSIATGLASGAPQLSAGAAVTTVRASGLAQIAGGTAAIASGQFWTKVVKPLVSNGGGGRGGPGGGGPAAGGPGGGGPGGGAGGGVGSSTPPAWFQAWQRANAASARWRSGRGAIASAMSRAGEAVRSSDRPGPPTSVNLR